MNLGRRAAARIGSISGEGRTVSTAAFSVALVACLAGCATGADDPPGGSRSGSGGGGGQSTLHGSGGGSIGDVISIVIEPPSATVLVENGVVPPATEFVAVATTSSGDEVEVVGTWQFDRPDLAAISESGALSATGLLGGKGVVSVVYEDLVAKADVTVKLRVVHDPGAVDPAVKAAFDTASKPDPSLEVVYPYDETVFPRGLPGPVLQWNGGAASDLYRVRAVSETFEFEGYGSVPPKSRYPLPTQPIDVWKKLTDSTVGDVEVTVQRYAGTTAYLPEKQGWTIAAANLAGTIHYHEVSSGMVVRIKPGATSPEPFLQGVSCVGCHAVSRDGSTIAASLDGEQSPWATFDAATGMQLFSSGIPSGWQAISPTGSHVLWGELIGGGLAFPTRDHLVLSSATSSAPLAQLDPGYGWPGHPSWSPDGGKIAFHVRPPEQTNGLWFGASELWVTEIDLPTLSFKNTKRIVDIDPSAPTAMYPSFSPDSSWIAFQRSKQSFRPNAGGIWITNLDGSVLVPLDRTNGTGSLAADQATATFQPTFLPVAVGGYFWIVVVSERKYGNTLEDTKPSSRLKQLWVSAIDANPSASPDPSHPAFWLPGQNPATNNMDGAWALSPCKTSGQTCEAGFDCCDGYCAPTEGGAKVCVRAPDGCAAIGDACTEASDCCDPSALCVGGFCAVPSPK